jgi:hypothetical protein
VAVAVSATPPTSAPSSPTPPSARYPAPSLRCRSEAPPRRSPASAPTTPTPCPRRGVEGMSAGLCPFSVPLLPLLHACHPPLSHDLPHLLDRQKALRLHSPRPPRSALSDAYRITRDRRTCTSNAGRDCCAGRAERTPPQPLIRLGIATPGGGCGVQRAAICGGGPRVSRCEHTKARPASAITGLSRSRREEYGQSKLCVHSKSVHERLHSRFRLPERSICWDSGGGLPQPGELLHCPPPPPKTPTHRASWLGSLACLLTRNDHPQTSRGLSDSSQTDQGRGANPAD